MKRLKIQVELLSPLSMPTEVRSNFPSCSDYISGSLLRGALAGQYIREYEEDDFFNSVFPENTIFGNLYPVNENITSFFPSSAVSCKRYGLEHGVKDNLFIFSAQELFFNKNHSLKNLEKSYCCNNKNTCNHDLKPQTGFYYKKDNSIKTVKVEKQVHIHTGINRDTGNVQEGIFYSLEEISPYYTDKNNEKFKLLFEGEISIKENHIEKFKNFCSENEFFMGSDKSRGKGRVKISSIEEITTSNDLNERLNHFNLKYQEYLKKNFNLDYSNDFFFSLDFTSDSILLDKFLRYSYLSLEMEKFNLIFQSVSSLNIKGWNSLWGLPKETEIAVKKGSCYLFSIPKSDINSLKEILTHWEENGLGLRKNEGFGKVLISNPFHIDNSIEVKI
ncbi:MAG: RAMP superfamily CRISPR-associated protein [Candidatus Sericytochromatia bacterium]